MSMTSSPDTSAQRRHLLAQRGLGHVQPGRGLQQAAGLLDADEVTKLAQFHGESPESG